MFLARYCRTFMIRSIAAKRYIGTVGVGHPFKEDEDAVKNSLLEELRQIGVSTKDGEQLLEKHPNLVQSNMAGKFLTCFSELGRFMPKGAAIGTLRQSPKIALRDPKELEELNDYVVERMGVSNSDMIKSRLFEHPIEHVRSRHLFLHRAGLYEMPNYKGQTKDVQNPTLRKIVDSSDMHFAEFSGLSIEEYRAFKNIVYLESLHRNDDMEEGDSSGGEFTHSEEGEQLQSKDSSSRPKRFAQKKKRRKK